MGVLNKWLEAEIELRKTLGLDNDLPIVDCTFNYWCSNETKLKYEVSRKELIMGDCWEESIIEEFKNKEISAFNVKGGTAYMLFLTKKEIK